MANAKATTSKLGVVSPDPTCGANTKAGKPCTNVAVSENKCTSHGGRVDPDTKARKAQEREVRFAQVKATRKPKDPARTNGPVRVVAALVPVASNAFAQALADAHTIADVQTVWVGAMQASGLGHRALARLLLARSPKAAKIERAA